MAYDFREFKQAGTSALEWLKKEYASIHTGRAMPTILDGIKVRAYDSSMSVNQLATVSIEDPKTLRVTPWDKEVTKPIDQAVRESNLGLSVALDATGLRISFPELTSERRFLLTKLVKEKLEEARIRVRSEREKTLENLERKGEDGSISEDDKFRLRNDLQKLVEEANRNLEELASKKEKEILE